MSLEEFLRKHLGCKKPFLKKRRLIGEWSDGEKRYEYMTAAGNRAYGKLVDMLYDLAEMDVGIEGKVIEDAIETLDSIVSGESY